jgi:FkbM family methyltransferase
MVAGKRLTRLQGFPNAVGADQVDAPIYFLHMPKTGGSTLSAFLETLYLPAEFWHRGEVRYWRDLLRLNPDELRRCQIINGHFGGYVSKHVALPLRYITFVREPLERALSHYEHVLRDQTHYLHSVAQSLGSFGAYLRDERSQPTVVNFQLRSIGANLNPVELAKGLSASELERNELERRLDTMPLSERPEELLRVADARMEQMCFVGLTERFDESLRLLCELFGWPTPVTFEARNVNPRFTSTKELPSADLKLLKRLNEPDIELYHLAKARFERDWARSRFVYPRLHAFVSYAQNCEDVLLYRALRQIDRGTYVDVGANDPVGDSVTKAFYDRGWRGINIEPVGSLYQALSKQRPLDINVQAAAGASSGQKALYEIPGTGLSTLDSSIAERHRKQGFSIIKRRIRVRTLDSILAEARVGDVHFLKIDVEGWELDVLKGLDLSATRPWIIVVEATEPNTLNASHEVWEPLLLKSGYLFASFDGLNRYYLAREHRSLKSTLSRPINSGDVFIRFSEASSLRALKETQWNLRKQGFAIRDLQAHAAELARSAEVAREYARSLEVERMGLNRELGEQIKARETEREGATRHIEGLTKWASSADGYAKALASECESLRTTVKATNDASEMARDVQARQAEELGRLYASVSAEREAWVGEREGLHATVKATNDALEMARDVQARQAEELGQLHASVSAERQAWASECESLRATVKTTNDALEMARDVRARQAEELGRLHASISADDKAAQKVDLLTTQLAAADARATALAKEIMEREGSWRVELETRAAERRAMARQMDELSAKMATVTAYAESLVEDLGNQERRLSAERSARDAERVNDARRAQNLQRRIADLECRLAEQIEAEAELRETIERERREQTLAAGDLAEERQELEIRLEAFKNRTQEAEANVSRLNAQLHALQEEQSMSVAAWQSERSNLTSSVAALQERLDGLRRHPLLRFLKKDELASTKAETEHLSRRKIGVFTIASKNYLAYVRVLFRSLAAVHPEYEFHLCLADKIDAAFDPSKERFKTIESDRIGIPNFESMTVRYDIMEFNTAVKPFMFRWLLDNTDLDSVIYLDPDIQVYSRFDRLEGVLASGVSMVLTPHITRPLEDGKNPNDYNMLQAGVFNLGFAAINRCAESRLFIEWWGRRLEAQGQVDLPRNLFTDQRWCDLAPCFLDRLHVFKCPSFNVAYWNLAERSVREVRGKWVVNGEPLAFFHFSGISPESDQIVSKHQNRFDWKKLAACKSLFDEYRRALISEGWEETRNWRYAYAQTKEGLPLPRIVRQLYRERFPAPGGVAGSRLAEQLLDLCNGSSDGQEVREGPRVTRLMELIHRQRPDLQAAFNLTSVGDKTAFYEWFMQSGFRDYGLSPEFLTRLPTHNATETEEPGHKGSRDQVPTPEAGGANRFPARSQAEVAAVVHQTWDGLPTSVRRLLAPVVVRALAKDSDEAMPPIRESEYVESGWPVLSVGNEKIAALEGPAPIRQLLDFHYISNLMHSIWLSRPDLQHAFDLATLSGQKEFASWFEASAPAEYGPNGRVPNQKAQEQRSLSVNAKRNLRPGATLIGYAHAELGMGEHVRMQAAAMASTSVQFGIVNFEVGVTVRRQAPLQHGLLLNDNPFTANVFNINADQMLVAYCHLGYEFFANRYNVGYWAWELAKCPPTFLPVTGVVDEVWAGSRFTRDGFAETLRVPVEYMPECVTLPEFIPLPRSHFGLPGDAFIFLYTFDFLSYVERKNPYAAIKAFKLAFAQEKSNVCLVLKVMNGNEKSQQWAKLKELIDEDPRVAIINQTLSRAEVIALINTSDCFVSLHRSEGFGRGPAEAMYLGKPVIATNYSGSTDFTLPDNSCLVNYTLIPVEAGQYPFGAGQVWADADVEHAAWYMKKVLANVGFRRDLGAKGQAYIRENFSPRAIGRNYERRLKRLGFA